MLYDLSSRLGVRTPNSNRYVKKYRFEPFGFSFSLGVMVISVSDRLEFDIESKM